QKSIYLEAAYFVPDEHVIDQLIAARKRGVEVIIIVPGPNNDSDVVDQASKELWGALLKEDIKIFQYLPALFHCKVLIVDKLFVSVGSTNFDQQSFRLNDEANLNILDKNFADIQIKSFDSDLEKSKPITFAEWNNRSLYEKIMSRVSSWLSTQL
ncbi:MAG: cardiolipin synthase B, partial [Bdellovibrionaceae bacterium]|nr:cardiolipin synthase B [Pseudobdellovibrionaceae bacterium]